MSGSFGAGIFGNLLGEMEEIDRKSASLIGEEQIAQINALKAHIESLENQIREKNELIDLMESKRPIYTFPVCANDILQHFLEITDVSQVEQLLTLQEIEAERDPVSKTEKLLRFLFALDQRHTETETRMSQLLRGHIVFLEGLCTGDDKSLEFLGEQELSKSAKEMIIGKCKETTEFLKSNYGSEIIPVIHNVLDLDFDPEIRLEKVRRFLYDEEIPYKELEALFWQESAIVYAMRKRLQEHLVDVSEGVRLAIKEEVRQELEAEIRKDVEDQIRLSIESDVREELQNELRPEIRRELEDDVRTEIEIDLHESVQRDVRSKLELELTPQIKRELTPEVRKQLTVEMTPQIKKNLTVSIRKELTPKIKEETEVAIKKELTPLITKELRATLTPKVKAEIQKSVSPAVMKQIKAQAISELEPKIAAKTERHLAKKLRPELEKQVRLEVEQSMQQERADAEEQMRSEIHEMREKLLNETHEDVRTQLIEEMKPTIINDCLEPARSLIQKALNLRETSKSMLDLVEELALQVIKARKKLGKSNATLSQQVIDLLAENDHLDQLHTQTRSILVRQAEMISQLRTEVADKWRNWALDISETLDAQCDDPRDESSLRLSIQQAVTKLLSE